MSDNKFIQHLKGKSTAGSLVEVKNQSTSASFGNMPQGTSEPQVKYADVRGDVTVVANGTMNWKISNSNLVPASVVSGDGQDFTSTYSVSGAGLWVNATYTFPSTGDPNHPVAMIFNPNSKWVLKLCGDNLVVDNGSTVDLTLVITFGTATIISKQFTIAEQANQFCKELVIDFAESNANMIKASGLSTMKVQVLCGTANASARIYNGMTVFTVLQRKVDASVVSANFANVEEVIRDGLLPSDYFSNAAFIDQVADGEQAYAVFERDGDSIDLAGWTPKEEVARVEEIIIKSDTIPTASSDLVGSIYQYTGVTSAPYEHGYIYECKETSPGVYGWERIDVQPGGSRGRFLALWNCATGLSESNPPYSPYEYKTGDYFIVGTVSSANPAVNYKPDGSSYTTGVASTTVETNEVSVNDTYFYDGTVWKLQSNAQKEVSFSALAGSPYDNTNLSNALNAKQDNISDLATIRSGAALGATAVQPGDLATVATTGDYDDLLNKPTIPTVNDATLTIQKNGTNVATFTANASSAVTANISVPTDTNDLTNGARYITGITSSDVTTALGYTPQAQLTAGTGIDITDNTISADNIVWVTYNSTPFADIRAAMQAGKIVLLKYTTKWNEYILRATNLILGATEYIYFTALDTYTHVAYARVSSTEAWIYGGQTNQSSISDLSTIRSGAAAGATAVQPGDLATVATSGSYNDLSDKPTIPAAQVNSDWNANSGVAQILNKPTLATVATSGSYNDLSNKPTIPTVNNPTITITQGGVTKGSFTLNQASGDTIALDAGGGGIGNIDNLTITANASNEIQAVATVNANTAAGAINPIYDWVGTLAEYTAQNVATTHPDWLCYITDDNTAQAFDAYNKTESDARYVQQGHQVIDFQEPTAANNYTWYRKYADGWVEQGGFSSGEPRTATLAVAMADTNYSVICIQRDTTAPTMAEGSPRAGAISTTQIYVNGGSTPNNVCWQVSGMAA